MLRNSALIPAAIAQIAVSGLLASAGWDEKRGGGDCEYEKTAASSRA
jgi:hypothetical protein